MMRTSSGLSSVAVAMAEFVAVAMAVAMGASYRAESSGCARWTHLLLPNLPAPPAALSCNDDGDDDEDEDDDDG